METENMLKQNNARQVRVAKLNLDLQISVLLPSY